MNCRLVSVVVLVGLLVMSFYCMVGLKCVLDFCVRMLFEIWCSLKFDCVNLVGSLSRRRFFFVCKMVSVLGLKLGVIMILVKIGVIDLVVFFVIGWFVVIILL